MPEDSRAASCGTCIYHDSLVNECRRRAPKIYPSSWPKVKVDDWCGEYLGHDGVVFGSEAWCERTKAKEDMEKGLTPFPI